MTKIHAIFKNGVFKPTEQPTDINEDEAVVLFVAKDGDVPSEGIIAVAELGDSFGFLGDPAEDIYSAEDCRVRYK